MATLMHNTRHPCAFDLKLLRWERYTSKKDINSDIETVKLGESYTLWVEYCMALRIGNRVLYQSEKATTLILEDIKHLIEDLRRLVQGKKDRMVFDPIEPDFELSIGKVTENSSSIIVSSVSKMRAKTSPDANSSSLFDVNVWIDYPNQVNHFYGGCGPGVYFYVEALDIERFASQLEAELKALGSYFNGKGE